MLQLGTDLLEDEGGIATVDEGIEQLLGVAEQEPVGTLVQLAYLLLNTAQEP